MNRRNVYGFEESGDVRALVLELVGGPTLAERLASGPLPIAEALAIARQIAGALEAAHETGIIHRDLKPANIKLTINGHVKVLDFGLAKAIVGDTGPPDLSQSPTITADGTRAGVILGTPAYMSPEQARGKAADKRTDIWAFACVLYEMLTGRRAFPGDTMSDTIAAVLGRDPDWQSLPDTTPAAVRRLLRRCLPKDSNHRLHDIADARIELEDMGAIDVDDRTRMLTTGRLTQRSRAIAVAWTVAVAFAAVLATLAVTNGSRATSVPAWSTLETVATQLTNYGGTEESGAISPDGRSFVFVSDHGGTHDIWLRQISGGDPVRLTHDAAEDVDLEFAPDGESIFFTLTDAAGPSIWRIGALGGQARKVVSDARRRGHPVVHLAAGQPSSGCRIGTPVEWLWQRPRDFGRPRRIDGAVDDDCRRHVPHRANLGRRVPYHCDRGAYPS